MHDLEDNELKFSFIVGTVLKMKSSRQEFKIKVDTALREDITKDEARGRQ